MVCGHQVDPPPSIPVSAYNKTTETHLPFSGIFDRPLAAFQSFNRKLLLRKREIIEGRFCNPDKIASHCQARKNTDRNTCIGNTFKHRRSLAPLAVLLLVRVCTW